MVNRLSMAQSKKKTGRSESALVKEFCARCSDEDLRMLADLLPQTVAGDRSIACEVLQGDAQVDKWLREATGSDDWFARVDSIGDAAAAELDSRPARK